MRIRLLSLLVLSALMVGVLAVPAGAARQLDVIVVFEDHVTDSRRAAVATARQHRVQLEHVYQHALDGFSGRVTEGRLRALRNDPRVAYVELDSVVEAAAKPVREDSTTAGQSLPWGVQRIGADAVAATGAGVHVYVLDTGIDADHPDLATNLGNGYAVETCTASHCQTTWDDDQGHGTHVAGTVGALDNDQGVVGVAPQVTLHSVKVLSSSGSGYRSGVIKGVDWVTSELTRLGVPGVVNMSLSGDGSKSGSCTTSGFVGTDSYHAAICNARNAGAVFAVAAGNAKIDASAKVPAAYDDAVITVSATTSSDSWASYSNWGDDSAAWTTNVSAPVAIGAPGSSVLSTTMGGGTGTKSGTSMAAPHVAGAAALLLAGGGYAADATAFTDVRSWLLGAAEETTGSFTNSTGYPHAEDFLDVRSLGGGGGEIEPAPEPEPVAGITLSVNAYKVKGVQHADLTWSGATTTSVDVFRNGTAVTTTANDGAYTDNIGRKGGGTYTYKVCEAGTSTCSADVTVTY